MHKNFKFRLYPNQEQEQKMFFTLNRCRELYNAALSERKDSYQKHFRQTVYRNEQGHLIIAQMEANMKVQSVTYLQQKRDLVDIKDIREEYKDIHSQVLQDVMVRLKKGMDNFFRRLDNGETPGFPRFQGRNRYCSFTYPQGGYTLSEKHVTLSKIGKVRVKYHREIEGDIKTCTIKHESGQWYVVFSCEIADEQVGNHLPYTDDAIGIDLGLLHFATLSTGDTIENPRFFRKAQKDLQRKQRHLSRCKKGSHRREKAKRQVAKAQRKIKNQRYDFLHKQSRQLVNTYEMIVFEDISSANMSHAPKPKQDENGKYLPNGAAAKAGLNKSILDAGWGMFISLCKNKAACADSVVLQVNPYKTSQVCSACHKECPHKDLSERTHVCPHCGVVLNRDHNAALNILRLGSSPHLPLVCVGGQASDVEAPAF